ncbi:acyltransferase [Staphylococcus pseudoxylosus]|uniref:acyltransferase n=1 Tax=Staphylococcus TaxID=1279 RepID=UPI001E532C2D|nr:MULTISPECIES: acyltransferase [Staphylococcus]MCD8909546.1 acyltransferase [Staphylococcus gallinarum]MEB6331823.1 acyltransferase [Staphylococcus pseudoxylosus]
MKYIEEIPIIRSIATLFIVCVHLSVSYTSNENNYSMTIIAGYLSQIGRLGTPVFAVISAFLLTHSVLKRGFDLNYFIKSRFTKIFVPYIIWTTVYLYYLGVVEVNLDSDKNFIEYYLYGTGNYHLYFILTVLQFYILFPFLQKIKKGSPLLLTYALSTILTLFWQLNYEHFSNDTPIIGTFVTSRAFIFNWISYFILGIIFAKYYEEINNGIRKYKTLLLPSIIAIFISFLIFIDLNHFVTSSHPIFLLYTPFFLTFLIYFYLLIRKYKSIMQILTLIGNYSMGIYLVHPLVKWLVMKIPIFDNRDSLLLYSILFITIVVISVITINLLIKIPNGNYIVPVPKKSKIVSNKTNYFSRKLTH